MLSFLYAVMIAMAPANDRLPPTKTALPDQELIARIKKAVVANATPEEMENLVGVKPIVNTAKDKDWFFLAVVRFVFDGETIDLAETKNVVYWRRPTDRYRAMLVGVAWRYDGSAIFFLAEAQRP